jgi:hypothetical protein
LPFGVAPPGAAERLLAQDDPHLLIYAAVKKDQERPVLNATNRGEHENSCRSRGRGPATSIRRTSGLGSVLLIGDGKLSEAVERGIDVLIGGLERNDGSDVGRGALMVRIEDDSYEPP